MHLGEKRYGGELKRALGLSISNRMSPSEVYTTIPAYKVPLGKQNKHVIIKHWSRLAFNICIAIALPLISNG